MDKLKEFIEKRNAKIEEMQGILDKVEEETRAFNDEEQTRYDGLKKDIEALDKTIEALEEKRNLEKKKTVVAGDPVETVEEKEVREFANFVRQKARGEHLETREIGESITTNGKGGVLIPKTISKMIFKQISDVSPLIGMVTRHNIKGDLALPAYVPSATQVGYQDDLTALTEASGNFSTANIRTKEIGALTVISQKLIDNTDIDLVNYLVKDMGEAFAEFIEDKLLNEALPGGVTSSYEVAGIVPSVEVEGKHVVAASSTAFTADELLQVQSKVKQSYQRNACWIMNSDTFTAAKMLKDQNGRYLLQYDASQNFPFTILGKPVYLSDNMGAVVANKVPLIYGDFSADNVILRNFSINILREQYAIKHAIGINGWVELGAFPYVDQHITGLKMKNV